MVKSFAPHAGCSDKNLKVLYDFVLAAEGVKTSGAQCFLYIAFTVGNVA